MVNLKLLLETGKDVTIMHLLLEIYGDEVKHHRLMKHLLETVIKRETLFEKDV